MKHNIFALIFVALFSLNAEAITYHSLKIKNKREVKEPKRLHRDEYKILDYGKRNWILDLKLKQRAGLFENSAENSFVHRVYLEPDFKLKISDNFYFDTRVGLLAALGSVQSRFGDLRAQSGIVIRDSRIFYRSKLNAKTQEGLYTKLSIGAIDQKNFLRSFKILMSKRALPGAEQIIKNQKFVTKNHSIGFDLRAFEGVPASQSLNLDFEEKESTPFYWNTNLELFFKKTKPGAFSYRFAVNGGLYDYSELPSIIADEGRRFGNSTTGQGANAEFLYDFKGWYGGWDTTLSWNSVELVSRVQIVTNTAAPDRQNQGQIASALLRFHDKTLYSFDIEPYHFFNERDASVASYNSTLLGHNNREGFGINLALNLPRRNLKFRLSYVASDLIEEDPSGLELGSRYVGFTMEYKNEL
jgi:hypothetical protein